jgi:hypothetical protein
MHTSISLLHKKKEKKKKKNNANRTQLSPLFPGVSSVPFWRALHHPEGGRGASVEDQVATSS